MFSGTGEQNWKQPLKMNRVVCELLHDMALASFMFLVQVKLAVADFTRLLVNIAG